MPVLWSFLYKLNKITAENTVYFIIMREFQIDNPTYRINMTMKSI